MWDRTRLHSDRPSLLHLPGGVLARIASFLPPGDAAYGLRPVCKAVAGELSTKELLTVNVGDKRPPVSHYALLLRWGSPGSARGLTYKQRFQLLLDAARGGSAEALAQLSRTTGCLVNRDIFYAAARAGHLEVCDWLLQQKCELEDRGAWVLAVAAEARHLELCQELHRAGFPLHMYAKRLAVRAGGMPSWTGCVRRGHADTGT